MSSRTQRSLLWGSSRFMVEINSVCNTDQKSWSFDQRAHHDDLAANSWFSAEMLDLKYFSESGLWNVRLAPDQIKDSGVATIFWPPASKLFGPLAQWVTATARFSAPFFKILQFFFRTGPFSSSIPCVCRPRPSLRQCSRLCKVSVPWTLV